MTGLAALVLILLLGVVMITVLLCALLILHLGVLAFQYARHIWRTARA